MTPTATDGPSTPPPGTAPTVDSELTWLLHRAAQRLRTAVGEHAAANGMSLRDHIVLSAMDKSPGLTQTELGRAVGLDKTTLTAQLDRLELAGLIQRAGDTADRRRRIPRLTAQGQAVRARIAVESDRTEAQLLDRFSDDEVRVVKRVLFEIIGDGYDPGSCM